MTIHDRDVALRTIATLERDLAAMSAMAGHWQTRALSAEDSAAHREADLAAARAERDALRSFVEWTIGHVDGNLCVTLRDILNGHSDFINEAQTEATEIITRANAVLARAGGVGL